MTDPTIVTGKPTKYKVLDGIATYKNGVIGIFLSKYNASILNFKIQSSLAITRPVITPIGCNAVGRASRFFGR